MPPRKRQDTPLELPICAECWPAGWRGEDVAATCSHGQWTRYPAEQPDPEPAADAESPSE